MAAGIIALVYGTIMSAGGVIAYKRIGSRASLIGGAVIGGLADIGGVFLLLGMPSGRGIALLGAVVATLFFGWSVSRAILAEGGHVGRPAGLAALSIVTAALLLWTA
ncbi:hypothetical protein K8I85_03850 [bacterium]|nr:hypothetical protein [bacterium]